MDLLMVVKEDLVQREQELQQMLQQRQVLERQLTELTQNVLRYEGYILGLRDLLGRHDDEVGHPLPDSAEVIPNI